MFPKFIQVGLNSGERVCGEAYIRDVDWVAY